MILFKNGEVVKYTLKCTRGEKDPATVSVKYMHWGEFKKWSALSAIADKIEDSDKQFEARMDVNRKQFLEYVTGVSGFYNSSGCELTDPKDVVDMFSVELIMEVLAAMKDPVSLNEAQVKNSERDSGGRLCEARRTESPSTAKPATINSKTEETVAIEND